jgi:hypothetical protein
VWDVSQFEARNAIWLSRTVISRIL